MGLFSTPTNEGDSRIDVAYKTGTQEEWRHQCPNCDEFHKLSYTDMEVEAVKGPKVQGMQTYRVKSVKWVCPDCGFAFTEKQMKAAPQKYVAQRPEALESGVSFFFI